MYMNMNLEIERYSGLIMSMFMLIRPNEVMLILI